MSAWASYPYTGSVVLITGGGTGIGRGIVRAFLEQGASVTVVGRTTSALEEAVSGFPEERVLVHTADLSRPGEATAAVDATLERFGRLDVVIASAGTSEASDVHAFDMQVWERQRAINLDSVVELAAASTPALKESQGNFLAISSIAGLRGDWGMFAYNATKAAVNVMMQSLALDLGAVGVRVNAIAPGFTWSRLTEERLGDLEFQNRLLDRIALGRVGQPDDIAKAALFVCSPDAGYLTGAVIPVDGGVSAASGTPRS